MAQDKDDAAETRETVQLRPLPTSQKTVDRRPEAGGTASPTGKQQVPIFRGRVGKIPILASPIVKYRDLLRERGEAPLLLAAFGPSERFLVLAISVTIWHASVAFGALIVGSAIVTAIAALLPQSDSP